MKQNFLNHLIALIGSAMGKFQMIESNQKLFTETDTHWEIHKPFDDSNSDNLPLSDISFLRGERHEIVF